MLRAGQSLPRRGFRHCASTLRFDAGRSPDAGSLLPGLLAATRTGLNTGWPDTSLRVDYLNATTSKGDITSRTHAAGHTKVPLVPAWGQPVSPRRCSAGQKTGDIVYTKRSSPTPPPPSASVCRSVSAADAGLPQHAGKAFARIEPFLGTSLPSAQSSVRVAPTRWECRHEVADFVAVTRSRARRAGHQPGLS